MVHVLLVPAQCTVNPPFIVFSFTVFELPRKRNPFPTTSSVVFVHARPSSLSGPEARYFHLEPDQGCFLLDSTRNTV
jgi:hypothetical protein